MNEEIIIKDEVAVDIKASLVLEKFKAALAGLERVVNSRSVLPILNHVLIRADKNGVELAATDLEVGVRFMLGGKVEQEGAITVPGRTLIGLVNTLHGETVNLQCRGEVLTVTCGDAKAKINSMSAEEFPVIPQVEPARAVRFKAGALRDLVSKVDFAAAKDEARPVLTGVLATSDGASLTLAATDSFRLAEVVSPLATGEKFSTIIPAKTWQEVKRLGTDAEDLEMRLDENQVMFLWPGGTLVSKVIEGEYPPYKQIIPETHTTKVEIDVQEFIDLLKTASVFSSESSNNVKLLIGDGLVEITSEASQVGNFDAKLPAKTEGEGGEISFNARYLLEGLSTFDTPKFHLTITTKTAAGVLRPVGDDSRLYMVMPLRG